jgi:hopene-associated glycosyltransferase HpnB
MTVLVLGCAALAAWLYLAFFHGGFWRAGERLGEVPEPGRWPRVAAVVPARNEAAVVAGSVGSLLDQDYEGDFEVVLVDDGSDDGTAERARQAAAGCEHGTRLAVTRSAEPPPGWAGKMWAVATGVAAARPKEPEYLLLTDADVVHSPRNLARLVAKAEAEKLDMVSLMVLLACRTGWDRLLVPAFVYFFQKLYPFPRVNDPRRRTAGAAGGCMLVRARALEEAGGIKAIRGELIDDCALGRLLKRRGPVWLGLTESERSVRVYEGLRDIWDMVARSAFTQLRYSAGLLLATVLGLLLIYLAPPALVLGWAFHGSPAAALLGGSAWALMAWTFVPTLRLYRVTPWMGIALPVAGALYLGMTVDSAVRHWRGRGTPWRGRRVHLMPNS